MELLTNDLAYFSSNYFEGRRRFLESTRGLPLDTQRARWSVPSRTETDLSVDSVYLPATAPGANLLVMLSGVHGLEGYAGSAIQSMFINEILPRLDRRKFGVLLVHSLNPFGFKNHLRNTENHVNLNRNCSTRPDLYRERNADSLKMSERFIPRTAVDSMTCSLVQKRNQRDGRIHFDDVSMDNFIKAVGIGQWENAAGLEFGGFQNEPQIADLIAELRVRMPEYRDVLLFDLHTGLGERGRLHLLTGDVEGSVDPTFFNELFKPSEDAAIYDYTSADTEGFYKTLGATNNIFPELARPGQRVCALTMEFGTLGHGLDDQVRSLNQWLLEHQGTHYGYANDELGTKIRADYLEKFFPAAADWRMMVIATSRALFQKVFGRAGALN
ncbi:MAG: DUF2817 domain-containing protein [Bdellovibrionaceae bacterium]|nr:DUF2817 domain-containing protein [Pseudobdellovibrionaceae bacterium]